jgi:hypothetical protein
MAQWRVGLALLLLGSLAATAQPTEHVTVTGTHSDQVIQGFVESFSLPTHFARKIARWETPICPYVRGIKPEAVTFVLERVKSVAREAGVPVSTRKDCQFNVEIIFTRTPQALMDSVRKLNTDVLGYAVSSAEKDRLAKFTQPAQAWYVTATRDRNGATEVDSPHTTQGGGVTMILPCTMLQPPPQPPGICTLHNPYARKVNIEGSFLGDKTHSILDNVLVVADPEKIANQELGTVSDYIAMRVLAQIPSPDGCQPLPSIINLFAESCDGKVAGLTETDRAYLRGLYQMQADMALVTQRQSIANEMKKASGVAQ